LSISYNELQLKKMAQILNGLKTSTDIKQEIKIEVSKITASGNRAPHLAAILVGENGASKAYVNSKVKDCAEVGFQSSLFKFASDVSEEELLNKIKELNENPEIDGFIVQLPLPKQMDQEKIIMAINPNKDVDGFHPENFGKMALEMESFLPATPYGILTLLEIYNIETSGKHCVIIGRSIIVLKQMSILMGRKGNPGNSTVTLTHSYTSDIEEFTKTADIVITALGNPHFLKADMIKDGAVIVDVGITRVENDSKKGYYLAGDVDFESCEQKASWITPVPGGVGPMTRAMLMKNTILAYNNTILKK
jgi:methylenetetrahydrofolate dehydrogenase (NADP+)/methenyltetrahydrofolate cyclohydrolase